MRLQFSHFVAGLVFPFAGMALPTNDAEDVPYHLRGKRSFVERNGVKRTIFEHEATGAKLDFVANSGICETTPGVKQYSGYVSVGTNQNIWFWFFEARHNPDTAPLATWFNGGPGCSSMIGLFRPFETGFSYGTGPVTSTLTAAPYVWALLQAFFANFPQYQNRDFGLFTESYGGHYGPAFASYFQSQNAAIKSGTVKGQNVNLVALGINNGLFDAAISYKSYIDFSYNNTYKQLISLPQHTLLMDNYMGYCLPPLQKCLDLIGGDPACSEAQDMCRSSVQVTIINAANFNPYDVRAPYSDPYPPTTYINYLSAPEVMTAIGAKSTYSECSNTAATKFYKTGDSARSFLGVMSEVVQSGITVLIWAGDADWICNWVSNLESAEAITYDQSAAFKSKAETSYTVNGKAMGTFKTAGNLSWLRVFDAGHEVPYYQPEVAFQAFVQTMQKKPISST
ncbi:Carboxypeptidase [Venustampulla echinocandica]|uniref:Carboxypeptidase n=1 Tax=Venustampulla echinocandica TaxID=2656787 RepID=A0A370TKI0_9HELO|nr:Carboxypeptidase [Venustampulla echinocandica]RDL36031.1 Carboxypeptidase [Venustampulla echinocandica]